MINLSTDTHRMVAEFRISNTQLLNSDGKPIPTQLPDWTQKTDILLELYKNMVLNRAFDIKAVNLQRTGKLGTYASSLGQEAIGCGVASAMQPEDVLLPTYREHGALFHRGVSLTELLLYWGGDERGCNFSKAREDFPPCVPIATQTLHAVGVAYAIKLRQQKRVAVCFLGDGASSKGDFYEAMNAAGTWNLPMVFILINNQWAISVPRTKQSAAATLAQKAIAAGISGEQVDGNDVLAIREVSQKAIDRARQNKVPHLIEMLSYRMGDHTTADDASRYRTQEELDMHKNLDPILRFRRYLTDCALWDADQEKHLLGQCNQKIEAAVEAYLATPPQAPEAMFDYLYASLPNNLKAQRQAAIKHGAADRD